VTIFVAAEQLRPLANEAECKAVVGARDLVV
jgi:hypothetical protein